MLSDILFVMILTEVYRLLFYYRRENRVSVPPMVQVALVGTPRGAILEGAHDPKGSGSWRSTCSDSWSCLAGS
jgi:uncharacterized membrane protein (DUF373 family)